MIARGLVARGLVACGLIAVLAAAGCTAQTAGDGRLATSAAPAPRGPLDGPGTTGGDVRSCPRIQDAAARLSYDCIEDSMQEIPLSGDPSFAEGSIRVGAYTEPAWLAAQQSGVLVTAGTTAQLVALLLTAQQTAGNYGPGATSATIRGADLEGLGRSAYRIDLLVTLDPAYAQQRGLAVRTERLCVVVVELDSGAFSAMTISVPDTRADLWASYDAIVAGLVVT